MDIIESDLLAMRIADALSMPFTGPAKLSQLRHEDRELICLVRARLDALKDEIDENTFLPEIDPNRVTNLCHFLGCSENHSSLCERIVSLFWRALQFLLCRNDLWIMDEDLQANAVAIRINRMKVIEKHWDAYLNFNVEIEGDLDTADVIFIGERHDDKIFNVFQNNFIIHSRRRSSYDPPNYNGVLLYESPAKAEKYLAGYLCVREVKSWDNIENYIAHSEAFLDLKLNWSKRKSKNSDDVQECVNLKETTLRCKQARDEDIVEAVKTLRKETNEVIFVIAGKRHIKDEKQQWNILSEFDSGYKCASLIPRDKFYVACQWDSIHHLESSIAVAKKLLP